MNRKLLTQLDAAVDQSFASNNTDNGIRQQNRQKKQRIQINDEIKQSNKKINVLNAELLPIKKETNKMQAEFGPIKYIADIIYGENATSHLDKAVRLVIIIIMIVFDPLAVLMLIAANISYVKERNPIQKTPDISDNSATTEKSAPIIGQMWFNPETSLFYFWNGNEWAPVATPAKEQIDIHDKIIIQPEIKVYPPSIDTDIIKTVVTTSMDNWLGTASHQSSSTEDKTLEFPPSQPEQEELTNVDNKTEDSFDQPIDETPDPGYNKEDDTFHPQEHFKPTHITYGKR